MVDPALKGKMFPTFSYTVERGKLREFLIAIGEDASKADREDASLPPTFSTVFSLWGGDVFEGGLRALGLNIWDVLHAEQAYEYLAPIRVGDTVYGVLSVGDIYSKGGRTGQLQFLELVLDYRNQREEPVLREKITLVVPERGGLA